MLDYHEAKFQFTLPRGERPCSVSDKSSALCFNSRSREGSDGIDTISIVLGFRFQFTLPRGERLLHRSAS